MQQVVTDMCTAKCNAAAVQQQGGVCRVKQTFDPVQSWQCSGDNVIPGAPPCWDPESG